MASQPDLFENTPWSTEDQKAKNWASKRESLNDMINRDRQAADQRLRSRQAYEEKLQGEPLDKDQEKFRRRQEKMRQKEGVRQADERVKASQQQKTSGQSQTSSQGQSTQGQSTRGQGTAQNPNRAAPNTSEAVPDDTPKTRAERAKAAGEKGWEKTKDLTKKGAEKGWKGTKGAAKWFFNNRFVRLFGRAGLVIGTEAAARGINEQTFVGPGQREMRGDVQGSAVTETDFGKLAPTSMQLRNQRVDIPATGSQMESLRAGAAGLANQGKGLFTAIGETLKLLDPTDDEGIAELEQSREELWNMINERVPTAGFKAKSPESRAETSRIFNSFVQFTEELKDPEVLGVLMNPNSSAEAKEAVYDRLATIINSSGANPKLVQGIMQDMGITPEVLNRIDTRDIDEVAPSATLRGDESVPPNTSPRAKDYVEWRDTPLTPNEEKRIRFGPDLGGEQNVFTDKALPGTNLAYTMDEQGNVDPQGAFNAPGISDEERNRFLQSIPSLADRNDYSSDSRNMQEARAYSDRLTTDLDRLNQIQADEAVTARGITGVRYGDSGEAQYTYGEVPQRGRGMRVLSGGQRRAREFAAKLRDPVQLQILDMQARQKQGLPGVSAAQLASMDYPERLAAITDLRNQGTQALERQMALPGTQRRIDQLADPDGSLRAAAKQGYRGSREELANAREAAREQLRGQLSSKYLPDYSALENTNIEDYEAGIAATQRTLGKERRQELDDMVRQLAGDDEGLYRTMLSTLDRSGVVDIIESADVPIQDQRKVVEDIFVGNRILQIFQKKTGEPTGTVSNELAQAFATGDNSAVQEMFGPYGDWTIRGTKVSDIIGRGPEARGALIENIKEGLSLGLFGNDGPNTQILLNAKGDEAITLKDLLADPIMAELLNPYLDEYAE